MRIVGQMVGALALIALAALLFWTTSSSYGQTLPDHRLTPGLTRPLTKAQICSTKWMLPRKNVTAHSKRHVTDAMKRRVFLAYGYTKQNKDHRCPCEIDHLIPRAIGGADDERNLFPMPFKGPWNARLKDRLETKLNREVCAGRLDLAEAQRGIADDWTKLYRHYYGEPK